jgi:hypothetical protein
MPREKMRLPGRIVALPRELASDPDALLTHPGIIRQGSPIFSAAKAFNKIARRI